MMSHPKDTAHFLCRYTDIEERLASIDPAQYDATRNYLDGAVTWLSPFITHGVINTNDIASAVQQSYSATECQKLLFELAWREYFHRIWEGNGAKIFVDMRNPSTSTHTELPTAIISASSGIVTIDKAINHLVEHGTMHNHARMWVAALCCNIADTHWLPAAKWMYYHLLDGDLASNTLSWQWVAGTFSNKRYVANQDNINKYSKTNQKNTFLDIPYEQLTQLSKPAVLSETVNPTLAQRLPGEPVTTLDGITGSVALRSVWNLNAQWQQDVDHQVLFIEQPEHENWPMSENRWRFILHWAGFIPNLHIVYGKVDELQIALRDASVIRESYPATDHWLGTSQTRPWLYPSPMKPYKSFSQFWKQVQPRDG